MERKGREEGDGRNDEKEEGEGKENEKKEIKKKRKRSFPVFPIVVWCTYIHVDCRKLYVH